MRYLAADAKALPDLLAAEAAVYCDWNREVPGWRNWRESRTTQSIGDRFVVDLLYIFGNSH